MALRSAIEIVCQFLRAHVLFNSIWPRLVVNMVSNLLVGLLVARGPTPTVSFVAIFCETLSNASAVRAFWYKATIKVRVRRASNIHSAAIYNLFDSRPWVYLHRPRTATTPFSSAESLPRKSHALQPILHCFPTNRRGYSDSSFEK